MIVNLSEIMQTNQFFRWIFPPKTTIFPILHCSHLHHNVSMRFLTCEPDLSHQANYTDEADIFYEDPVKWLRAEYSSHKLPTHVILFDRLLDQVGQYLADHGYRECRKLFHTHIPEGRVGSHVLVWCLRRAQKHRVFRKSVWNGVLGSFINFYMESFSLVLPCMVMRTIHHHTSQSDGPFLQTEINSSPPSAVYIHQWIRSALVQIMACPLCIAKPLSKPMLDYY